MPRALKNAAFHPHWDKFDIVLLGTLTTAAILAIAAFAYIVVKFAH